MNFFFKIAFLIKKPQLIVVTGGGRACAAEAIFQLLKRHFGQSYIKKINKPIITDLISSKFLVIELEPKRAGELKFFLQRSERPILVGTAVGEIPADEILFAGEKEGVEDIAQLIPLLRAQGCAVLNFDDETVRELGEKSRSPVLTFGLYEPSITTGGADFQASDVHVLVLTEESGTNFKLNYKGNIVPVWLKNLFGKEQIYSALCALALSTILDINLVQASQALGAYQSLPGKMRLVKGVKGSWILDDSENASPWTMVEALAILGKIEGKGRKAAVLGDILDVGKMTIEAHQSIAETAVKSCNLLFTVGLRAKLIGQRARALGFPQENIFEFSELDRVVESLQKEIREGDLVLVDGGKEMKMEKIVEAIEHRQTD